jgi:O-antigen/teichoic acid export membrane protein
MIITYAISVPFFNVWSTRMYTVIDEPGGHRVYARVGTWFLYALLFAWVVLASTSPEIVAIAASRDFAGAAPLVPIVAAGYIAREASEFSKNAFLIRKHTRTLAWLQPFAAAVNIALTFALVHAAGAMGAAWATALTFALLAALTAVLAERVLPAGINRRHLVAAAAVAGALYAASRGVRLTSVAWSLAAKIGLVTAFPAALFALRIVPHEDRAATFAMVRRARARIARGGRAAARESLNP